MKYMLSLVSLVSLSVAAQAPVAGPGMGRAIYEQTGANSCLHCHGIDGAGGKVAAASKLAEPKTWKVYKGMGGDAAYAKDPTKFLENMRKKSIALLKSGAVIHNGKLKDYPFFDVKLAGGTYNSQMLGLQGSPSVAWLKRQASKGVTADIAAESVYLYIQSFDKQNVFKK